MDEHISPAIARATLRRQVAVRSVPVVADDIGVHPQVLRDFLHKKTDRPRGMNWERIRSYAGGLSDHLIVDAATAEAEDREDRPIADEGVKVVREPAPPPWNATDMSGATVKLSRIAGYAEAVLHMLENAIERQRELMKALDPHIEREGADEHERLRAELEATATAARPIADPKTKPHSQRASGQ